MSFIKSWFVDLLHFHKWEIYSKGELMVYCKHEQMMVKGGMRYTLQCTHCGKLKQKDIY